MYTWGYLKSSALHKLDLTENEAQVQNLLERFPYYANEVITQVCSSVKPKYTFAKFVVEKTDVWNSFTMPDDFVAFGDDVCYELVADSNNTTNLVKREIHDDDYEYYGSNEVVFKHTGTFYISYNARWYDFSFVTNNSVVADSTIINVPEDILDCIPSYIASQCYKIDDEYKSSVYRNEYEIFLARINDTNYKNTKTLIIEGGW